MFRYPSQPHQRRHEPRGYRDPRAFKPWLRDEFDFRCVFCLMRESWTPSGSDTFSVEHLRSQSIHPSLRLDYKNLAYACCGCNSAKQDIDASLQPDCDAFGEHFQAEADGTVIAKTLKGRELIAVCQLNRPALVTARRTMQQLRSILDSTPTDAARELAVRFFGLPVDLPNLAALKPPLGNGRPEGIAESYFERNRRHEFPEECLVDFEIRFTPTPTTQSRLRSRIAELYDMKNAWLDGVGQAPTNAGLDWLSHQLETCFPTDASLPFLYPTAEGGVQLKWSSSDVEASLEIDLLRQSGEWHCLFLKSNTEDTRDIDLSNSVGWGEVVSLVKGVVGDRG